MPLDLAKARQRLARYAEHFQRSLDTLGIGWREPRGRDRIDARQLRMHRRPAAFGRLRFE